MNLKDIREECWDIAREIAVNDSDRLWSTREMNRYINRAYRYIARETRCIRDSATTEICRITCTPAQDTTISRTDSFASFIFLSTSYVSGSGTSFVVSDASELYVGALVEGDAFTDPTTILDITGTTITVDTTLADDTPSDPTIWFRRKICPYLYTLDDRVIHIEEVKWTSRAWRLTKVSCQKWQINPWWEWIIGMPTEFATDLSNNTIALNFRSLEADTLRLVVQRMPLADLTADTDIPEIRSHYHDFIINGVLWQMYSKQDSQTFDNVKALDFKTRFDIDVNEIKQQESILGERLRPNHSLVAFR